MESSHRKDTANHPDPESCGTGRKARHEALTGADAGEVSSREIRTSGLPTLLSEAEGNMQVSAKASSPADPRGRRPSTRIEASRAGTGRPRTSPSEEKRLERPSKAVSQTVGMSGRGESDESVVSKKPANRIQKSQWRVLRIRKCSPLILLVKSAVLQIQVANYHRATNTGNPVVGQQNGKFRTAS